MKKFKLPKIELSGFKKIEKKMEKTIDNITHKPTVRIKSIWLVLASLSYLNILVLIPLIFARKSQYAQFHAKQGIALLSLWLLLFFSFYVQFLPFIIAFFILVCMIIGITNVVTGHERKLPVVGRLIVD